MADVTQNAEPVQTLKGAFQNRLAWVVFLVSTIGILSVAWFYARTGAQNSAREVFSTIVPLFGTWVGTILAFYFSRENFREANDAVNRAFAQLTPDQKLQQTSVRQVMKTRGATKVYDVPEGRSETNIRIAELLDLTGKGYSRVPIFAPGDVVRYIVHESLLNKFVAETAKTNPGFDLAALTLSDFLAHPAGDQTLKDWVSKKAFVKVDATLADARGAMLAIKGCQDVFVTQSAKPEEPVLGWLTNTDITRDL
jgi:hypothetical protein